MLPSHWLVQVNPFYEHSSAGGAKVKVGVEVKEEGQGGEGGTKLLAPPYLINSCLRPISKDYGERTVQIFAGYKLELGAMIASGCLFGFQKCAWLTYGSASLTLGYYLRVEDNKTKGMNEM